MLELKGKFPHNPQNPFGIHFLKFFLCVTVLALHSLVFISIFCHYRLEASNIWLMRFLALFPNSLLVPITAGATQGILLQTKIQAGRLRHYPLAPTVKVLLFLAFLESFKAAVIYMPAVFFGWNVIHMVAISLIVILLLSKVSIYLVWLSALLCLALTPHLRTWLLPFQVADAEQAGNLNKLGINPVLLATLAFMALGMFLYCIFRGTRLKHKFRFRLALLGFLVFDVFVFLIHRIQPEFYFAARLINLPIGALIGDQLGLHYWPLFPWYATVAIGFALFVELARTSRPYFLRGSLLLAALLCLLVYFTYFYDKILTELDVNSIWSSKLFAGSLWLVAYAVSSFALFALACEYLSNAPHLSRWAKNHGWLERVPFVYSKTIFWAYLFVNSGGVALAYLTALIIPPQIAIVAYPITVVITWYWLGKGTIRWLTQRKFSIRLSPAN